MEDQGKQQILIFDKQFGHFARKNYSNNNLIINCSFSFDRTINLLTTPCTLSAMCFVRLCVEPNVYIGRADTIAQC